MVKYLQLFSFLNELYVHYKRSFETYTELELIRIFIIIFILNSGPLLPCDMGCGKVVGFLLLFVLVVQCKVVLHGPTVYMEFEENLSLVWSTLLQGIHYVDETCFDSSGKFVGKASHFTLVCSISYQSHEGYEILFHPSPLDKLIYVNATTPCAEKKYHKTGDAITFNWNGIKLEGTPYTVSGWLY